jgi:hypothetical protein
MYGKITCCVGWTAVHRAAARVWEVLDYGTLRYATVRYVTEVYDRPGRRQLGSRAAGPRLWVTPARQVVVPWW